jgi:hypothetical protein
MGGAVATEEAAMTGSEYNRPWAHTSSSSHHQLLSRWRRQQQPVKKDTIHNVVLRVVDEGTSQDKKKYWWKKNKTDRAKRAHFSFGRKLLTDEKSPQLFLRSMSNPTHHSLPFCVLFLAVGMDLVGKRCGRKLGGQFGQFIAKSPL